MRVFVAGATGVMGQYLVPSLVAAGHEVTGTTRSTAKAAGLRAAGATPVIVDGLDRRAVLDAVKAAQPEVIVHQMTALASMSSFRNFDKEFAVTNELRVRGTDYLLEAAQRAGTRRFIAQSFIGGWNNAKTGGPVKSETDPLDPDPLPPTRQSMAAMDRLVVGSGSGSSGSCSLLTGPPVLALFQPPMKLCAMNRRVPACRAASSR